MRILLSSLMTFLLLLSSQGGAQSVELVERTFLGTSKATSPVEVKREIQEQAAQKVSEDIIKELIGEAKFAKNKSLIQSKVIKNSSKYIPFLKPSEITQEGEEFKMSVILKLSLRDLKQMLQSNSLLAENDSIPVALPLIVWNDRVQGRSYRWWLPQEGTAQNFLIKQDRVFEEALRTSFQKNNFYVIKPTTAGLGNNIPVDFHNDKVSGGEDAQFLSQFFNAPLLIDGQVLIQKGENKNNHRIEIRMTAIQVSNGRAIADVSRSFETESGALERVVDKKIKEVAETTSADLASQVLEAWQRGSVGTSVIRLTIQGKTPLPSMEGLKEKIRSQLTQVKNIRERLVSAEMVSFELDISSGLTDLATKLEALDLSGRKLAKVSESSSEVVVKWAQ